MTDLTKFEFQNNAFASSVNAQFAKVEPGFFETSSVPALITPAVVPAAVMATQGSVLCANC